MENRKENDSLPLLQELFLRDMLFGVYIGREEIMTRMQYLYKELKELVSYGGETEFKELVRKYLFQCHP